MGDHGIGGAKMAVPTFMVEREEPVGVLRLIERYDELKKVGTPNRISGRKLDELIALQTEMDALAGYYKEETRGIWERTDAEHWMNLHDEWDYLERKGITTMDGNFWLMEEWEKAERANDVGCRAWEEANNILAMDAQTREA